MMQKITKAWIFAMVLVAIISCDNQKKGSGGKASSSEGTEIPEENPTKLPNSVGKTSELLVVMNKGLWESQPGDTVKAFFSRKCCACPRWSNCTAHRMLISEP